MIDQQFADAGLSTAKIAERLGCRREVLIRQFRQYAGVTLLSYLTRARLREARMLLTKTPDDIAEVARKCSFASPAYFCRWFRKHTGTTPQALRHLASA